MGRSIGVYVSDLVHIARIHSYVLRHRGKPEAMTDPILSNYIFDRIIMALVIVCLSSLLIGIVWRNVRDWLWQRKLDKHTDGQIRIGMRMLNKQGRLP